MSNHQARLAAARAYRDDVGERVRRFLPMVRKLAWHLSGSGGPTVEADDLMQAGLVALTECARKHAGPGEDGFAAYARLRVRGAMVDLLRSSSAEARGARGRRRQVEEAERRLRCELGRKPTGAELAGALGVAVEQLHRLGSDLAPIRLISIEDCYSDNDSAFACQEPDGEGRLLQLQDREALARAISALPERLKLVVQLYFVEELNLAEIAAVLSVSVPRVHQLKAAALKTIRLALTEEGAV